MRTAIRLGRVASSCVATSARYPRVSLVGGAVALGTGVRSYAAAEQRAPPPDYSRVTTWKKEIVVEGSGPAPTKGATCTVHYVGTLASNGSKFDSSRDRREPFQFQVGRGQVIRGWDEGVMSMKVGETARLIIGPDYGYGARGVGPIPGGAVLVFEVELLSVK